MAQANEASVEEILESIKKVIARDNREEAANMRRRRETDGVIETTELPAESALEDEVLDLGEMEFVEDSDVASHLDEAHDDLQAAEDAADNQESDEEDGEPALINASATQSMRANLEALAMLAQPSAPPQIVRSGETSLEGLARELLRPMLAEWLDTNLPDMVERLVQDEIARIARKDHD